MPRNPRFVAVGELHHITQRGSRGVDVFQTDGDRYCWLNRLFAYAERYRLEVHAWCLMSNHIHLIATPGEPASLARLLGRLQGEYARYFNLKSGWCGHLWEQRYYSCPLDAQHAMRAMAYVERNPVRAGMVAAAWDYPWSSARAHVTGQCGFALAWVPWRTWSDERCWRAVLADGISAEAWRARLRDATRRGLPLGSDEFVAAWEQRSGRELRQQPQGRPPAPARQRAWAAG